jgi:metallo-beta-lactamase family protein
MKKFLVLLISILISSVVSADIYVTPFGAAGMVSGSSFLVERAADSVIVDCGLFMGEDSDSNKRNLKIPPKMLAADFLILTHAHTDHIGRVPFLFSKGFKGKVYSTKATRQLAFTFWTKGKKQIQPFYTAIDYDDKTKLFDKFYFTLSNSAHIPGSASILFEIDGKKILFSGDLGSGFSKLSGQPEIPSQADIVFIETTNAAIEQSFNEDDIETFHKDLLKALAKDKIVWIPALSFNRTQKILYELKTMQDDGSLDKDIPIYSLSPSANRINVLYEKQIKDKKAAWFTKEIYKKGTILPVNLQTKKPEFDKKMIVLSSSGDMDMGMSKQLLKLFLPRKDVFVMIVNYVSPTSAAGKLLQNKKMDIHRYGIFSGHPDSAGLLRWLSKQNKETSIYLIHGDKNAIVTMLDLLKENGWKNVKIAQLEKRIDIK